MLSQKKVLKQTDQNRQLRMDKVVSERGVPPRRKIEERTPTESNKERWEETMQNARRKPFDFWSVEYEVTDPPPIDPKYFKHPEDPKNPNPSPITPDGVFDMMCSETQATFEKQYDKWYVPQIDSDAQWWLDYASEGKSIAEAASNNEEVDNEEEWCWEKHLKAYVPYARGWDQRVKIARYIARASKREGLLNWSETRIPYQLYNANVKKLNDMTNFYLPFVYRNTGDFHELVIDYDELREVFGDLLITNDEAMRRKIESGSDYHISLMKDHHLTQHINKKTKEAYDKDNLAERLQIIKEKYRNKRNIHIPSMYVSSGSAFNFYVSSDDYYKNYERCEDLIELNAFIKDAYVFDKPGVTAHISFD